MTSQSPQRATALAIVAAFNRMDVEAVCSYHSPTCLRHILPSTLGFQPQDTAAYLASLRRLAQVFQNFSLTVTDILEDKEARRVSMWLKARADTLAGEYVNEYVWTLDFDETGMEVTATKEFVDTVMVRDFWPSLQAAMAAQGEKTARGDAKA